jgi:pre-mRNA-splicing factor ATP-dependent RNA helicase DHX15/PRP43
MAEPPSKRSKVDAPGPSTAAPNPYLAHRTPDMYGENGYGNGNGASSSTGANGISASGKVANPLNGLVPRKVGVDQAKRIMVSSRRHRHHVI